MKPAPYKQLSDLQIVALCVWREARGEPHEGKRGVAHVIKNRVNKPCWWGKDWHSVVLQPYQFSSFNANDPNNTKWPVNWDDVSFNDALSVAAGVTTGLDDDNTGGATHYHDSSIAFPAAWGPRDEWELMLEVGRLSFYRKRPAVSNHDAVQSASTGEQ